MRKYIRDIFLAGVAAVQPAKLLPAFIHREEKTLHLHDQVYSLPLRGKLWVWGAGKAAAAMAGITEELLGDIITGGIAVTKYGHSVPLQRIRLLEAAHPVPDENGRKAAGLIAKLARKARQGDVIIGLLSGGASSLMADIPPGISLPALSRLSGELIRSGASIGEINTVRKQLATLKGGRLGQLIHPAAGYSFIISDVTGDPPDIIASGPTVPDDTSCADAVRILKQYALWDKTDPDIRAYLQGQFEKKGAASTVTNIITGNNRLALNAAAEKARELGFEPEIITQPVTGETRRAAVKLLGDIRKYPPGTCLLAGGETTVKVKGRGKGGRNQEFALAALTELQEHDEAITVLSGGTDGTDGPTEQAGAIVDKKTLTETARLGLDPQKYLEENDSFSFFEQVGGHLYTGPTQTNVMDLMIALKR